MSTPPEQDKRHVSGPRALGAVLPAITRPAFRKRSPAAATLMADWSQIVGPAIAAVAAPVRFSSGTLTIAASGPIALELQHLAPELIARLNGHVGRVLIERLRFAPPVRLAGLQPPPAPPPPRATALAEPQAPLEGVPDGPVGDALRSLRAAMARR